MDVRKMRNEKLGARVVASLNSRNMEMCIRDRP